MTRRSAPDIEVAVQVIAVTSKAVLVDHGGKSQCWIPKSQISDWAPPSEEVDSGTTSIFISEWIATEKGIL